MSAVHVAYAARTTLSYSKDGIQQVF